MTTHLYVLTAKVDSDVMLSAVYTAVLFDAAV